ncbi:protein FAM114A2-like [Dreissena polymorpha]|nr:protein FAM114A2-like [Dreissena polymorpha]
MSDSEDDFASADEGEIAGLKPEKGSISPSITDIEKPSAAEEALSQAKGGAKADEGELKPTSTKSVSEKGGKGKKGKRSKAKGKQPAQKSTANENLVNVTSAKVENAPSNDSKDMSSSNKPEADVISSKPKDFETKKYETSTSGSVYEEETSQDTYKERRIEPKSDTDIHSHNPPDNTQNTPEKSDDHKEEPSDGQPDASLLISPSSQSIQRPPLEHTDKEEAVLDKLSGAAAAKKSGWGWGWGSSLLEVASSSVATFTKEVGEGLHTVMETVESTLNVPSPEDLVRKKASSCEDAEVASTEGETETAAETLADSDSESAEKDQPGSQLVSVTEQPGDSEAENQSMASENKSEKNQSSGWFSSWGVSNITKMVGSTSKHLVTGSLDALESLGKKSFEAIKERDPGLKKTRGFLHDRGDKPNLSAVLREAKEQEEKRVKHEKETEEARKAHFGSLFDEFQGLAHLEALEMLSNQCEKRVNTLLGSLPPDMLGKLKPLLLQVKAHCEIGEELEEEEEQEFTILVIDLIKQLNVGVTADKLIKAHDKVVENLQSIESEPKTTDAQVIHQIAISCLAEFTSKSIEQFHKSGELILLSQTQLSDFVKASETLLKLTKVLCTEVSILSTKFTGILNKQESKDEIKINHLVTNIYLEASNSSSYIQDGFQLLLPVLQQVIIEGSVEPDQL